MQRDRRQQGRRTAGNAKDTLVPRSSSPVSVYVDLPCVIEQAFSTIAWDDLEDCASLVRRESDSLNSQVNDSDGDDQDFGDYALDFMADSPATLESNLSPAELVPFQGGVLPLITTERCFSSGPGLSHFSTGAGLPFAQDGAPWQGIAQYQGSMLGNDKVNNRLHGTPCRRQEEVHSLQERSLPLRQLASRAKHLASVLDKLLTVGDPRVSEPAMPCSDRTSLSPCKRQRLDEGYETEPSDSVEDMLRDISTRCNAVLHGADAGTRPSQEAETIRMHGAFSGLQTSFSGAEPNQSVSSFRTSVREHCTMRTRVFPHGRAFTSATHQGGYRFRWVPDHS
ncbi:multicilin [Pungitius pungitius]|uniref:multicilin n=1 Tax=Pungitius pungitius TaxID=134920 RepID=UPI002E0F1653